MIVSPPDLQDRSSQPLSTCCVANAETACDRFVLPSLPEAEEQQLLAIQGEGHHSLDNVHSGVALVGVPCVIDSRTRQALQQ